MSLTPTTSHLPLRALMAALLAITLLLLGACPGLGPVPTRPPQVTISVPNDDVLGDHLHVTLSVSGCPVIKTVTLLNNGATVKQLPTAANPIEADVFTSDIAFDAGIPAQLVLSAEVTCSDGRHNTSQQAGAKLFPVAQVYANADGTQIVPDTFYAEGSGSTVSFVGCALQANGLSSLVRVNTSGSIIQANNNLPVACDATSWFTDAKAGLRWMVTPNVGAFAFNGQLSWVARAVVGSGASASPLPVRYLGIGPDGDAMAFAPVSSPGPDGGADLFRAPHAASGARNCGDNVWCVPQQGGAGNPTFDSTGKWVAMPARVDSLDGSSATVTVSRYNYATGVGTTVTLFTLTKGPLDVFPNYLFTFNPAATVAYLAYPAPASGYFGVRALDATQNTTTVWDNVTLVGTTPEAAIPFAGGNAIAAISAEHTWVLSAATGQNIGPAQASIDPGLNLATTVIQNGKGNDFYLLNAPVSGGLPQEVVALDGPTTGEVYRYRVPSGTIAIAIDDSGQPWLRVGAKLVEPLTVAQYRALRGH